MTEQPHLRAFRENIQRTLCSMRDVTDVAFTPMTTSNGQLVEVVSFWEGRLRAHFPVAVAALSNDPAALTLHVAASAACALEAAKARASEDQAAVARSTFDAIAATIGATYDAF